MRLSHPPRLHPAGPIPSSVSRRNRSTPLTDALRLERQRRRWPADAVAAALGVSQSAVSAWEVGQRRPSAAHLAAWRTLLELEEADPGEIGAGATGAEGTES
jgi:transcriptional regulator with XRE-family HTH domain